MLCGIPVAGYAQDGGARGSGGAFASAELGIAAAADAGAASLLQRYWRPGPGLEATARAPFYAGTLEVGFQHMHHDARGGDVPGFRGRFFFLGWDYGVPATARARLGAGLRLGMYEMRFDGDTIPGFRRNESELALAVRPTLDYALGARWSARAAAAYQVVFTHHRVEQVLLSGGVSRRFSMPSWLRDFLD